VSDAVKRIGLGPVLARGPLVQALDWLRYVNEPQTEAEVQALHQWICQRRPDAEGTGTPQTARRMGLKASLRPRGRPQKQAAQQAAWFCQDKPHA
jgi:hypothetical protein